MVALSGATVFSSGCGRAAYFFRARSGAGVTYPEGVAEGGIPVREPHSKAFSQLECGASAGIEFGLTGLAGQQDGDDSA